MISPFIRATAPALAALLLASTASAQYAERPADRLSRYLRELSANPESVSALIGAGQAAIDVGDGNAALGFFARADERSPRSGPVKAGLARALLMVDNPREALKMFDAARQLGVPDAALAGDRGLAYDLRGENRRAQQDYVLALIGTSNDEVTKRYALSLGITGNRDQALRLLDPLLYKRDQGAWRARAFVLAMTGDTPGATKIVYQVMPERMAQTMVPFLGRLAALTPAQKAAAVHLGEMPSNIRFAATTPSPQPSFDARATMTPTPTVRARPAPESREPRRRPGATEALASPPPERIVRAAPPPTPTPAPAGAAIQIAANSAPPTSLPVAQRGDLEAIMREIRAAAQAGASTTPPAQEPRATPVRVASLQPRPAPSPPKSEVPAPQSKKLTGVEPARSSLLKVDAKALKAAADKKKKPEPPKHPARIWVQVAGGANIGALPREWSGIAAKAAELKGKGPWTAKNRATNRLLAGPFKTEAEAQAAVGRLRKEGVGAFQWQSEAGEAVDKLGAK